MELESGNDRNFVAAYPEYGAIAIEDLIAGHRRWCVAIPRDSPFSREGDCGVEIGRIDKIPDPGFQSRDEIDRDCVPGCRILAP